MNEQEMCDPRCKLLMLTSGPGKSDPELEKQALCTAEFPQSLTLMGTAKTSGTRAAVWDENRGCSAGETLIAPPLWFIESPTGVKKRRCCVPNKKILKRVGH